MYAGILHTVPGHTTAEPSDLFPYLEKIQDHLVRSDPASPFSGAAKGTTIKAQKAKKTTQRPPRTHAKQHQIGGQQGRFIIQFTIHLQQLFALEAVAIGLHSVLVWDIAIRKETSNVDT
jgi:hypothetical protein